METKPLTPESLKLTAAQSQKAKRALKKLLLAHLEERSKKVFLKALSEVLLNGDVLFLNAMGISGRKKMLDVFIKQCKILKKEETDL